MLFGNGIVVTPHSLSFRMYQMLFKQMHARTFLQCLLVNSSREEPVFRLKGPKKVEVKQNNSVSSYSTRLFMVILQIKQLWEGMRDHRCFPTNTAACLRTDLSFSFELYRNDLSLCIVPQQCHSWINHPGMDRGKKTPQIPSSSPWLNGNMEVELIPLKAMEILF